MIKKNYFLRQDSRFKIFVNRLLDSVFSLSPRFPSQKHFTHRDSDFKFIRAILPKKKLIKIIFILLAVFFACFDVVALENTDIKIRPGKEMTLSEAIKLADSRNLDLKSARMEIQKANALTFGAKGALLFKADAKITASHMDHADTSNFGGGTITIRKQNSISGSLDVSMPLVSPVLWKQTDISKKREEISHLTYENIRQTFLFNVAEIYLKALGVKSLIDVYKSQLDSALKHFEIARARITSGVGKRLDLLRSKQDVQTSRENLILAHTDFDNTRDAIGVLTGAGGYPMPVSKNGEELSSLMSSKIDKLTKDAQKDREDLKLKREGIKLSQKEKTSSYFEFLPSLLASWQLSHQFTETGDMSDDDKTRWKAFLILSVPLFSLPRHSQLKFKRAEIEKAQIDLENSLKNADLEVRTAYRDYKRAIDKIETAKNLTSISHETLMITQTEYMSGTGSSLAVTDARKNDLQMHVNLATRQFNAKIAFLKLYRTIGGNMLAAPNLF